MVVFLVEHSSLWRSHLSEKCKALGDAKALLGLLKSLFGVVKFLFGVTKSLLFYWLVGIIFVDELTIY